MELKHRLDTVVGAFSRRRILVMGDLMLDRYWWGDAQRLSPEAPVPVLRKRKATVQPGGAANSAANLTALGAAVELIGAIGADPAAVELCGALDAGGIGIRHLLECPERPTTSKTRIVAFHQHIVRVDEEETGPITEGQAEEVARRVQSIVGEVDALIISDYAKGFLTPFLLERVIAMAKRSSIPVFVDPKGPDWSRYRGATLLKPNRAELAILTGLPVRSHEDTLRAAAQLLPHLDGTDLLVTEGEDGMTLFRRDLPPEQIHPAPQHVYDVTGAGDTALATLAIARAAGASYTEAMTLATYAAGLAVATVGTAIITADALRAAIEVAFLSERAVAQA